jgi:Glyoxalase-like domain
MPRSSRRTFLAGLGGAVLSSARASFGANEVPASLDHLLLGCSDLDRGVAFVKQRLGVYAAKGGAHPGRGTQNALLSLGDRHYLEIISPSAEAPASNASPETKAEVDFLHRLAAPRLVGWAAHPGSLDEFASRLRREGIAFQGPQPGSRQRPDGRILHWRTLNLKDDQGGVLPFFIEWSADGIHPSADSPHGAELKRFAIAGPHTADLAKLSKLLNLDVEIEHSQKPQLRAVISGPHGKAMDVTS